MTREEQIAHLSSRPEYRMRFQAHQEFSPPFGDKADIAGYFECYGDDPELYWNLCADLDIKPLKPLPEKSK